ncbi:MAG: biotin/lipoyl-containing protein [Acidobacteriota bacterium]
MANGRAPRGDQGERMELIVRHGEREANVHVEEQAPGRYRVQIDDASYEIDATPADGSSVLSLLVDGHQWTASVRRREAGHYRVEHRDWVEDVSVMDPLAHLAEKSRGGASSGRQRITAYMPGVVKTILVAEGDTVSAGQPIAVLEAMKMENEIACDVDGTVTAVAVEAGQAVEGGDLLVEITPPEAD